MPTFYRWLQTNPSSGSSPCSHSPCFSSFHITYPSNSKSCPLSFQNVSWFLALYMEHSSILMRLFQCLQGLHSSVPAHSLSTLDIAVWWLQDWSDNIFCFPSPLVVAILCPGENSVFCERPYKTHMTWPHLLVFSLFPWAPDFPNLPCTCSLRCVHFSPFLPHSPSLYLSRPPSLHVSLCTL